MGDSGRELIRGDLSIGEEATLDVAGDALGGLLWCDPFASYMDQIVGVKQAWDTPERLLSLPAGEDHSTIWDHSAAPPGAVPSCGGTAPIRAV